MVKGLANPSRPLREAPPPAGDTTFLSWNLLEMVLRSAGIVRPAASVETFVVGHDGVEIRFGERR